MKADAMTKSIDGLKREIAALEKELSRHIGIENKLTDEVERLQKSENQVRADYESAEQAMTHLEESIEIGKKIAEKALREPTP